MKRRWTPEKRAREPYEAAGIKLAIYFQGCRLDGRCRTKVVSRDDNSIREFDANDGGTSHSWVLGVLSWSRDSVRVVGGRKRL